MAATAVKLVRLALVRAGRWQEALPYQAGDLVEVLEQGVPRTSYSTKPWKARLVMALTGGNAGWDVVVVGKLDLDGGCSPENYRAYKTDPLMAYVDTMDYMTLLEPAAPGNS